MRNVTVLISCLVPSLTEAQRTALEARVEWTLVNRRLGRVMLDVVGDREDLTWLLGRLNAAALDPKVIARFRQEDGRRIAGQTIDVTEYLRVAPDLPDGGRPVAYRQVHGWLGWAQHRDEVEA